MTAAMKHLEKLTRKRLGEILVDEGLISKSQLSDAQREQKRTGMPLGAILVESDYISEWDLAKTVGAQYQLPFVELGAIGPAKEVDELFALEECKERRFYAVDRFGKVLTLAVAEMPDIDFLRDIHERTGLVPFLFVSLMSDILGKLEDRQHAPKSAGPTKAPSPARPTPAAPPEPKPEAVPAPATSAPGEAMSVLDRILPDEPVRESARPVRREPERKREPAREGGWESIFDSANESVLHEVEGE